MGNTDLKNETLKITLMGFFSDKIAPENISTIALYHINNNLWDTLITNEREPSVGKIEKISDDQRTYTFSISEFAIFSNGRKITSEDVKFSIDRIIAKEENGHANAKGIIDTVKILSPNEIEIKLKTATPSFLFLLSTPEFAIIPKEICDEKTLAINSLNITSGAYVVTKINHEKKMVELMKNSHFSRHEKNSPRYIEVSFSTDTGENPESLTKDGNMFFEISNSNAKKVIKFLKNSSSNFSYAVTKPSLSNFLKKNPKHISSEKARGFSALVKKYFEFETETEVKSLQFFPPRTFGSLNENELPGLVSNEKIDKITIKVSNPNTPLMIALKNSEEKMGVKLNIVDMKSPEEADFIGSSQGMNTDFPEVELFLAMVSPYAFISVQEDMKSKINEAFHEVNAEKRSLLIKKIGIDLLESGTIIPVTVRSYLHVFNSKAIDASQITTYDGDIPFWKIKML